MIQQLETLRQLKIQTLKNDLYYNIKKDDLLEKKLAYYENMKIVLDYPYLLKKELTKDEVMYFLTSLGFTDPKKRIIVYNKLMSFLNSMNPYPLEYQKFTIRLEEKEIGKITRSEYQVVEKFKQLMDYHFYHDDEFYYIGTIRVNINSFTKNLQRMFRGNKIIEEEVIPMIIVACTYDFILSKEEIEMVDKNIRKVLARFETKD